MNMTVQTDSFFVITDLVREKNNFRRDAAVVNLRILKKFVYLLFQFLTVFLNNFRRAFFYAIYLFVQAGKFVKKIFFQMLSFSGTCLNKSNTGFFKRFLEKFP